MRMRINININVGRVVKYFVLSDLFLLAGWGFIEPIFSVFIVQNVVGATIATVGIAAGMYWLLRSFLEIPIANYLDKRPHERADFMALVISLLLATCSAIAFVFVKNVWELYLAQVLHAIAFAIYLPSWTGIFSRHLDKNRVSFDWSLDSTAGGLAEGCAGLLAGAVAAAYGFVPIFLLAGGLSFVAAMVILATPEIVLPKPTSAQEQIKDHTPASIGM